MTADEALAEISKVIELLKQLDKKLRSAIRDPTSKALPLLQREISDAMARKEWLFDQIQRMEKAGSLEPPPSRREREAS
jgi:hypothetical protein